DGTSTDVPTTVAQTDTIILPPATQAFLDVILVTDLIDWTKVRLVRVTLDYSDTEDGVSQTKDYIFSPSKKDGQTWHVDLQDKTKDQYAYTASYFMSDGTQKTVGPKRGVKDRSLILDPQQS